MKSALLVQVKLGSVRPVQQKFKLPLPFLVEEEKVQNSKKKKKRKEKNLKNHGKLWNFLV